MKKVLLTSTALVAFAGAAAADVSITGSAEMGVSGGSLDITDADGNNVDETVPTQFFQDIDVTFSMSGETDGGLAFGAAVDLDEAPKLGDSQSNQGVAIFISGDFGTLTLGDTDGALDFVTQDMGIGNPGSINDAETVHFGYLGSWLDPSGDGQIVRYDYSFDAWTFAASIAQIPSGPNGLVVDGDDGLTWALGVGYEGDFGGGTWGASLGYQYSDEGSIEVGDSSDTSSISVTIPLGDGEVAATAVGGFVELDSGFSAALTYTWFDFDDDGEDTSHIGVGAGYSFDAWDFHANYGQWDNDGGVTVWGWGISAGYDLGGGASLLAGYGQSDAQDDNSSREIVTDIYSFGLSFSF